MSAVCEHVAMDAASALCVQAMPAAPGTVGVYCPCCGLSGRVDEGDYDPNPCPYCGVEAVLDDREATSLSAAAVEHFPQVVKRNDGDWGVVCYGCSQAAQDYVYPCKVRPDGFPPPVLTERAA